MANIETILLPHLQQYPLYVALFKNVKNAPFLRKQLLDGNADFEYAFLDAQLILSRMQILAACFKAINDMSHDRLKSRNVHSEIVFSLSPNNNIAESFRRFGVTETTQHVLAIKVGVDSDITADKVDQHLKQSVEGEQVEVSDEMLTELVDLARLKKIYKLNSQPKKDASDAPKPPSAERNELEIFVLGSMALKGS